MSDAERKSEIDAKRARIARIREQRMQKEKEAREAITKKQQQQQQQSSSDHTDIDELVDSLVGPQSKFAGHIPQESSRPSSSLSEERTSNSGTSTSKITIQHVFDVEPRKATKVESYSKEVQTDAYTEDPVFDSDSQTIEHARAPPARSDKSEESGAEEEPAEKEEDPQKNLKDEDKDNKKPVIRLIDPEDQNEDLDQFLNQSWRVIGRALEDDYDVLVNYGQKAEVQDENSDSIVSQTAQFYSELSVGRAVTGIDWSSKFPELAASSHTEKNNDPSAAKGLVQIWNMHVKSRPEYVFHAQSDILAVKFSPFEPNLVFGTAYNGQILTWDLRSGSPEPILKSPLTGSGHAHPVYTIQITGTTNANNLITSSTDGTVCTWTSDLLAKPQDRLVLSNPAVARNDEVSPTSLSMSPRHPTQFMVGTEEGAIYQCNRFDQAGSRAGLDTRGVYKGHLAPVTALDFHSSKGAIDFGDYLLSGSLDWSMKLWKVRAFGGDTSTSSAGTSGPSNPEDKAIAPVLDFKRDDTIYDVQWSPHNPGVFSCVDGSGHLELWNLGQDVEVPLARIKPTNASYGGNRSDSYLNRPLNRLSWSPAENRIAVGGLDGVITVFDVALPQAQPEDYSVLKRVLSNSVN